jgi:putative ABC transport system permease protein
MKNELKLPFYLAFQSIRRGRKWTLLLTIFLMSVAFVNLIFVSALFNGIIEGSNQQVIDTLTSDIYANPKQSSEYINNKDEVVKAIEKVNGVAAVSTGFQIPARIEHNSRSGRWPIIAINPNEYSKVINVSKKMYKGKYLSLDDKDGIIIGRQIAGGQGLELNTTSLKGLSVGDKVKIIFDGFEKTFIVRGIFYTKFVESDSRAFISNKALINIMPNFINKATVINILTDAKKNDVEILNKIKRLDLGVEVYLWKEAAGLMRSVSSSFSSINVIMTLVGVIIASVTTFIVIYVDIINRRRQIGILRAIGIKPYIIVSSYVIMAAVYIVMGIVLGSIIYICALVPYFIAHPFVLPLTDAVLKLTWVEYIARAEIVIWVAIFSGLIPALIVTRTKMLDAIIGK